MLMRDRSGTSKSPTSSQTKERLLCCAAECRNVLAIEYRSCVRNSCKSSQNSIAVGLNLRNILACSLNICPKGYKVFGRLAEGTSPLFPIIPISPAWDILQVSSSFRVWSSLTPPRPFFRLHQNGLQNCAVPLL